MSVADRHAERSVPGGHRRPPDGHRERDEQGHAPTEPRRHPARPPARSRRAARRRCRRPASGAVPSATAARRRFRGRARRPDLRHPPESRDGGSTTDRPHRHQPRRRPAELREAGVADHHEQPNQQQCGGPTWTRSTRTAVGRPTPRAPRWHGRSAARCTPRPGPTRDAPADLARRRDAQTAPERICDGGGATSTSGRSERTRPAHTGARKRGFGSTTTPAGDSGNLAAGSLERSGLDSSPRGPARDTAAGRARVTP